MLETYQLKQQYHQLRQELSNALYENDAAKRVIARLAKERDEARNNLANITAAAAAGLAAAGPSSTHSATAVSSNAMEVDTETASAKEAEPASFVPAKDFEKMKNCHQE